MSGDPSPELVLLTPADWRAHRDLRLSALTSDPEAFGATYAANAAYDEATWRARLTAVTYWQVRLAGVPVGMAGLWDPVLEPQELGGAEPVPFLIAMFVRPEVRGTGIGGVLVREAMAEAGRRGYRRIMLDVRAGNAPALALYRRHGFLEPRERGFSAGGDGAHGGCEIEMVADISRVCREVTHHDGDEPRDVAVPVAPEQG